MAAAIAHHQAGRLRQAEAAYRQVLLAAPSNFEAFRLLGMIALQVGDSDNAIRLINRSLALNPANPWAHHNLGEAHRMRNERDLAAACFARALSLKPDFVEAINNLARIDGAEGRYSEAEAGYRALLALRPTDADAHFNLGNLYLQLNRLDDARVCYERALNLKPGFAEAKNNLGKVFQVQGNLNQAIACFQAAVLDKPSFALAHSNLGTVLQEQDRIDEACACYQKALSFDATLVDTRIRLGTAFHALGRYADARARYREALSLKPDDADAQLNLGNAYFAERRYAEAEASCRESLRANPKLAQAHSNLGNIHKAQGDTQTALACYAEAVALKPDFVEARWAHTMSRLPLVYGPGELPTAARADFAQGLCELSEWFDANPSADGSRAVGSQQPFALAYQEEDNRALLSQYGDLCARLMRDWWERQAPAPTRPASHVGAIRVGICSAHVRNHSVWNALIKGWLRHIDRGRFSLHVFHTGAARDAETEYARSRAAHFEQGRHGLRGWVNAILGQQVDVLIYPEIGMDQMTAKLASLRLAPVQAANWGVPETTGLPTIDYYISAQDMEPANAAANYRERLILLPHLGCCYNPSQLPDVEVDFAALGIIADVPLMLCPGTPFKYAPQHDAVLVEIANRLRRCQFVFCNDRSTHLSGKLQKRLEAAFETAGLDPRAYLAFIPWQPRPQFRRLLERADVCLDTIGFSGFNTIMQAVENALPIVALEGRFMRGRLGSSILRRMQMDEWVAASVGEYATMAVRLGQSAEIRQSVRAQIVASRDVLFDDVFPVRALEAFLEQVVRPR